MYSFVIDRRFFGQVLFVVLKFDFLNLIDDIIILNYSFIAGDFNIYLPKLKIIQYLLTYFG